MSDNTLIPVMRYLLVETQRPITLKLFNNFNGVKTIGHLCILIIDSDTDYLLVTRPIANVQRVYEFSIKDFYNTHKILMDTLFFLN